MTFNPSVHLSVLMHDYQSMPQVRFDSETDSIQIRFADTLIVTILPGKDIPTKELLDGIIGQMENILQRME